MQSPFFIIISGPTGVGKTAIVTSLAHKIPPFEVINADMGQMYTPLTIGTAKPDYLNEPFKQHLFDCIDTPHDWTVAQYRERVIALMEQLWARSVIPVLVGGSGFYLSSLFFPPRDLESGFSAELSADHRDVLSDPELLINGPIANKQHTTAELWQELYALDPARAQAVHQNDRYRIERALGLWYHSGTLPSACIPPFSPPARCVWYNVTRDKDELMQRIDARVVEMFAQGWIDEVKGLDAPWREFLLKKKLIGYAEICAFLDRLEHEAHDPEDTEWEIRLYEALKHDIRKKTRAYAKRQLTYWRMLKKKFSQCDPRHEMVELIELNVSQGVDWEQFNKNV